MIDLRNLLVFDIETVPQYKTLEEVPEDLKPHWSNKAKYQNRKEIAENDFYFNNAGIYSEFGKIVCISVGIFVFQNEEYQLRTRSYYGNDEKVLLQEFKELIEKHYSAQDKLFCGHNLREFDLPYIARRMMINNISIPSKMNTSGKKPWEVKYIMDTMELWKFGDYKNYTSLALLATVFGIPTPKDDIDGSMVGSVYWHEDNLERIVAYCQKDVVTTAQVFLKLMEMPLLKEEQIIMKMF